MSSSTPARHTTIAVWICVMIPFALIISAALLASLIYCTKHRGKNANGTSGEEGAAASSNNGHGANLTTTQMTMAGSSCAMAAGGLGTVLILRNGGGRGGSSSAARVGDSEGLNELGEAPPPYGIVGRSKMLGSGEDGEDGASREEVEDVTPVQGEGAAGIAAGTGVGAGNGTGASTLPHPPAYDALMRTQPTAVAGVTFPVASV